MSATPAEKEPIFAVVANWNGGPDNLECIASLVLDGLAPERIVFVDNGSSDGSLALVKQRFPGLFFIANPSNRGFGEAANQGARAAIERHAGAVFFVNNDVVVPRGTLARLERALTENPRVAIVGPLVLDKRDPTRVWCAGGMLTWRQNLSTLVGQGELDGPRFRTEHSVDYVAGCALLARSTLLWEVGFFDPAYFAYMEDVDLCLRARRAGHEVRFVGEASVLHQSSSSTGGGYNPRRKWMMGVNSIWFLRAHAGPAQWLRFVVFDVLSLPFLWIGALFRGRGKAVIAKALGILDGLRGKRVTAEAIEAGARWLW